MFAIFQCALFSGLLLSFADCALSSGNVVYPRLLEARGLDAEKTLYIDDDMVLRLEKTSVLSEGFVFSNNFNGTKVDQIMNGKKLEANMYYDRNRMASVDIEEKNGGVQVKGILSDTLRIAPLDLTARSEEGPIPHKIFEVEQRAAGKREKKAVPPKKYDGKIFHAELKIVVDVNHRKAFQTDDDLVEYLALCMKLVNLRYEETSNPQVQFLLTTVEIAKEGFEEVFYAWDVDCPGRSIKTYMDPVKMIAKVVETYGHNQEDITVFVTSVDLADNFNSFAYNHVMGQAKLGGLCSDGRRAAIVEDAPPTYSLIQIIAHELAHTLGAAHDGDESTRKCSPHSGHMMAPSAHGSNNGHFSNCSIQQISEFVRTLNESCLEIKLQTYHEATATLLPGKNMSLTDYCRTKHPNFPNITAAQDGDYKHQCKILCCAESGYPCFDEPAVDGMPCGGTMYCLRHKCGNHTNPLRKKL
uniref:Putative secreted metalloprotease n=1 Tax=Ixodes ricinus TaxID=34613 RepID=A0A6B0VBS4_IXORI